MTKLIDLGRASEETRGTTPHSEQIDPLGCKVIYNGVSYRTADCEIADRVLVEEPS